MSTNTLSSVLKDRRTAYTHEYVLLLPGDSVLVIDYIRLTAISISLSTSSDGCCDRFIDQCCLRCLPLPATM